MSDSELDDAQLCRDGLDGSELESLEFCFEAPASLAHALVPASTSAIGPASCVCLKLPRCVCGRESGCPWIPWSQGRQEEVGRLWKESWELEEQDVQLPRPLSATESREVWSGVSSSVELDDVKAETLFRELRAIEQELVLGWL